jgi:DNA-binding transcriptional LysR family regulator
VNIDHNIDRTLLRCFDALVTERSVSRAAERVGVTQPTMSTALARLRLVFGDPLLLRARGMMTPTNRALELVEPVRAALANIDGILARTNAFDPATSRARFTLTAPEYVEYTLVPPLIEALQSSAPHISLDVRSVNPAKALEWLESGEVDLRVGWVREPATSLRSMVLFRDRFVCLARSGHPEVKGRLTSQQYLSLTHVRARTSPRSDFWRVLDEATGEGQQRRARVAHIVQDFMVTPRIVAGTDFIAVVPERFALSVAGHYSLQMLKSPLRLPAICISAYWHERSQREPAHRWFRKVLTEVASAL